MSNRVLLLFFLFLGIISRGQQDSTLTERISAVNVVKGNDLDTLFLEVQELQRQAMDEGDSEAQVAGLLKIAQILVLKAEFDSGLVRMRQAYNAAAMIPDTAYMARSLNAIGVVHKNRGDYERALEYYEQALSLAQAVENKDVISSTLMHLGVASVRIGQLNTAQEYYDLAEDYWPKEEPERFMVLNINQGNLYLRLGQPDKALEAYEKALNKAVELDDHWRQALCYNNIAEIDYKQGRNEEAIAKFRKAQSALGPIRSHQVMFYSTLGISMCFHEMGDLDSALYYIRKAAETEKPVQAFTMHRDGAIFLAWIFAEREEWDSAYKYEVEVGYWRDSIDALRVRDKLIELQVESRLDQKNRELRLSQELEEHQRDELALKNRLLVVGIIVIILAIGVAFYLVYLVRRLRMASVRLKEHQHELTQKNAELEELNVTKDKVFSILAHDLRTPLISLESLFSIWLAENDSEHSDLFKNLQSSLGTMRQMLDNLLYWSKDQLVGNTSAQKESVDIAPLMKRIIEFYGSMASAKNVRLEFDGGELSPVSVDPNHLGLILRNLASNAIKFSPPGGVVKLSTSATDNHLTICVEDEGAGMSEELLGQVANNRPVKSTAGTLNETGTGLGLMLVFEYAALNDIEIRFSQREAGGTKACIDIPRD